MKKCNKCKEVKSLVAFGRNTRNPDGLEYRCHGCRSEGYKKIPTDHPSRIRARERCRKWHQLNTAKACARAKAFYIANRPHVKAVRRMKRFGLTPEEYNQLLVNQGGRCAICHAASPTSGRDWHIDHDHTTGAVRGILCGLCNGLLGFAKDNPVILEKAIAYLQHPPAVKVLRP